MDGLEESECNAIIGPDDCIKCGFLISSQWQIDHPGTDTCEQCHDDENIGDC